VTAARPDPAVGRIVADETSPQWRFEGELTLDNAAALLAEADELPLPSSGIIDLSQLARADSSALAVAIEIKRRAKSEGRAIAFEHVPAGLMSLAVVYGVDDMLAA
jgi:phospholipid transport system transporter-binding protein